MYTLVQDAGRDTDYNRKAVWPSGWHFASPLPCWQRKISHLVTKQSIVFDTPIRGCKTMDDVTVTIDVCVVFRIMGDEMLGEDPSLVREFVHTLGPTELGRQLKDAQDERVRALARSVKHTEVYSLRSRGSRFALGSSRRDSRKNSAADFDQKVDVDGATSESHDLVNKKAIRVTENMKQRLNAQFNKYGVQIIDVAIQHVSLPNNIAKQMEARTTYIAEIEEQKQKQLRDMQSVNQREEIETLQQKHAEEHALERERGEKLLADAQMKHERTLVMTERHLADIHEQTKTTIMGIRSESKLDVQRLASERDSILEDWRARAVAETEKLLASCEAYETKKNAEAKLVEIRHAAMSKKLVADVEGKSKDHLKRKRTFLLQKKEIEMFSALAENERVVITGKHTGQGMLPDLVMSQKHSNVLLNVNNGSTPSS